MRIGIITFSRALNHGASLQAYALKKTIENLGHDCEIINYRCEPLEIGSKLLKINKKNIIKSIILSLGYLKVNSDKNIAFKKFWKAHFNNSHTKPLSKYELVKLEQRYDFIITGSDQVWNYKHTNFDLSYFLDFVKDTNKKMSYAASFGFDSIPEEYKKIYKENLETIKYISVREHQGARIISELLNKNVQVVLDPTLLIKNEEWLPVAKRMDLPEEYILLYLMDYSQSIVDFAHKVSKEKKCKILFINDALFNKRVNAQYIRGVGPDSFINLFYNARYIITNSFHGIAFSLNFNKQFCFELLPPPAMVNSRIENIVELLGVQGRQIIKGYCDIDAKINYDEVNRILNNEREKSLEFLNNNLSLK